MSQNKNICRELQMARELQIVRELQVALMRIALAFDCIIDVIDTQATSSESKDKLILINIKLMRRTLEDAKDNIENAISVLEIIASELFK